MSYMFWVWLAIIVVTAVVEFATVELVSIWFTIGAIVPFILAGVDCVSWWVQVLIFILISATLILSLRGIAKRYLTKGSGAKTNVESFIGKEYLMLKRTDFETVGEVKINGVVWSAIDVDGNAIEIGERVRVLHISGNKLIVEKVEKTESNKAKDEVGESKQAKTAGQNKNSNREKNIKPSRGKKED